MRFESGDSILFKRGGSWREYLDPQSGNNTDYIMYGAYGTGPKPRFIGSLLRNETTDWFNIEENIWSTNASKETGLQLLSNPSFDTDTVGWVLYNDTGTIVEGYRDIIRYDSAPASYGINCTTKGVDSTDISLRTTNINLIEGCLYNFSFRAKSTQAFNVSSIDIINSTAPYNRFYSHSTNRTPTIRTIWTIYSVLFRVSATTSTTWLIFSFGDVLPEGSTFNIDTLSFKMLQNDTLFYADIGNIILNNEQSVGVKVWNESDLDTQGEFWFDEDNWIVKLYSVGNPATVYTDGIELCLGRHIIDEEGKHHIIYENLHLMYSGAHGIAGGNTEGIIIRSCDFSYIGGSELPSTIYNNIRFGNAIEFWSNARNNLVEFNRIWEIYDAAITNQGTDDSNTQYNLIYRNNTIWNVEYSFEIWNQPANSNMSHIYFENNTCYNAGFGWGHSQRYDPYAHHLLLGGCTANVADVYIRNNIFYETKMDILFIENTTWPDLANVTLDYNKYYTSAINYMMYYQNDWYLIDDFETYQVDKGQDQNSIILDEQPVLKNLNISPGRIYVGNNILATIEISSIFNVNSVFIEIAGKNHSMSYYDGKYNYTWKFNSSGTYNYTIFAYDLIENLNQIQGAIRVYIPVVGGDDDENDDDDEELAIAFGNYYLFFSVLGIIYILLNMRYRIKLKLNH